ncbi:hypothetical protein B0T10DRAFT_446462 [Thelonectria olida]|uniref:Uncharacterized protein n=1 Tax=Thelonectria olida TaxID=1576542 RepID=A0A9P9AKG4_9HYPO|nr:hypothetical protein B0T10DRAFT_446462 [Thelonectria olida]
MATLLAPYNTAMQLGSGFNSYTQQLCINDAVVRDNGDAPAVEQIRKSLAQEVTYKTSIIDKVTDVTSAMNINAAFAIKYDAFDAKGKGDFINTSKVKESDVSFMISVKVVNQVIYDHDLNKFNPIDGIDPRKFAEVYGDSFISGFQEGGQFTAVISVKAKDRRNKAKIKASAAINFTKEKLELSADGEFGKSDASFLDENETTVSVTWSGGGQELKGRNEDWTLETMRAAALKFPDLVSETPLRTHAILTKYTALRSFHSALKAGQDARAVIPNFEQAGVYTSVLQEAYLDYKNILKNLQVLAFNVSSGTERLLESTAAREGLTLAHQAADATEGHSESDDDALVGEVIKTHRLPTKPYEATLIGLEQARQDARFMMNRIVLEVDNVTRRPELAVDETRKAPYLSPFLFKDLLPNSQALKEKVEEKPASPTQEPSSASPDDFASRVGSTVRF